MTVVENTSTAPTRARALFTLLLTLDGVHPGASGPAGAARRARGEATPTQSGVFDEWVAIAHEAERAGIDALFIADAPVASPEAPLAERLEPVSLLSALSRETTSIGLIGTASTSFNEPYNVARQFASLHRLSNGRAGWNSVGTSHPGAAENFGDTQWTDHARRYRIGSEFTAIVRRLWAAGDKPIDHHGEFFTVRGPLDVHVTENDRPVVAQAGGSPSGIELAARFADVTFANVADLEASVAYVDALRAVETAVGRADPPVLALPGVVPYLADTEEDARAYKAELDNAVDIGPAYPVIARYLHVDVDVLRSLPLDEPFPLDVLKTPDQVDNSVATFTALRTVIEKTNPTVREFVIKASGGNRHREFVGTPEAFAVDVEQWIRAGGASGFTLLLPSTVRDLAYFADRVSPVLRRRGTIPERYADGGLLTRLGLRPQLGAQQQGEQR